MTFSATYGYNKTGLLLNKNIQASSFNLTLELLSEAKNKSFDDDGLAIQDLVGGQADGFLTASVAVALHLQNYPDAIYAPDWGQERRSLCLPEGCQGHLGRIRQPMDSTKLGQQLPRRKSPLLV